MSHSKGTATTGQIESHTYDLADFPEHVQLRLMHRAMGHVLRNEVAAKVSALKAKRQEAGEPLNDAEIANAFEDFRSDYLRQMLDGTWGSGTRAYGPRGPSANREDAIFMQLVKREVMAYLNKLVKSGNAEWTTVDGNRVWRHESGMTRTLDEAATNYIASAKVPEKLSALRAEAKERFDAETRAAAIRAASQTTPTTLEDLGL